MKSLLLLALVSGQDLETLKDGAIKETESIRPLIDEMASTLWTYAEIGLRERKSADHLSAKLRGAGFAVDTGVAGMPTAFVATWGKGKPIIGILAEYDALPGVGNRPVPKREPRADGVASGHGCGHNLFGAGSVGGAIALKRVMEKHGLKGTVKLFGSPAEETLIGKVYMAKAGIFDGLDAALDWHPSTKTNVKNSPGRAMNSFEVEFFGKPAHGAVDPWNGRSALDAVEMMNFGVNLMREHVKPTARIHYVIPNGGEAPNVVPSYTKVWYYVRDVNREEVAKYYQRILKIAKGAALATETTHKVRLLTGVHGYVHNRPMQEAIFRNLKRVGAPTFTDKEQEFAKSLQRGLGIEAKGFRTDIEPLPDKPGEPAGGSTDVAEVSRIVQTAGFRVVSAAEGIAWHSWATTACHGTAASRKASAIAAKVIALTGLDLLRDAGLLKAAWKDFEEKTKGRPYRSPLPPEQKPPLPKEDSK